MNSTVETYRINFFLSFFKWILLFLVGLLFLHRAQADNSEFRRGSLVPTTLVVLLEEEYVKQVRLAQPKEVRSDLQIKMNIPREYFEMKMSFTPKGGSSLEEGVELEISQASGVFELSDFLSSATGLFAVKASFSQDWSEADRKNLKVFFIPRYDKRDSNGIKKGLGCGFYAEITNFFKENILDNSLLQTTSGQSYSSMLLGTYILVSTGAEGLKIASFTLLDKRFDSHRCSEQKRGPVKI